MMLEEGLSKVEIRFVKMESRAGVNISDAIREAMEFAVVHWIRVIVEFNGREIDIDPERTHRNIYEKAFPPD
jgi:hypothetical protein